MTENEKRDLVRQLMHELRDIPEDKEVPERIFDSMVHDLKSQEASGINNDGFQSQIEYMLEAGIPPQDISTVIKKSLK